MPRGSQPGERRGGRAKGTPNKKTQVMLDRIVGEGITPLEYMLECMRLEIPEDAELPEQLAIRAMRFEAAKAAAPYVHPKLQAMVDPGDPSKPAVTRVEVRLVGG